ncbi:NADH-quinone oxidoreductase subunit L [Sandaracinobacteroides saxicola]|uniref:Probable inorganic carbon transporter subunit DabB n=1 Tax=Sandaracinobacteroides saxicola TaxID=2759707 RepID=A0A7G5ILF0_9SPHN|nr:NADH-quinone oxidoreductase subunit L [Sandaracinobacteroides saxicola]QMW24192.1 NADH-quinone oxidoreductase subunit L [Sandaracinobacteroides saxicola]
MTLPLLLAALVPLAYVLVALFPVRDARVAADRAVLAATLALVVALGAVVGLALAGPVSSAMLGADGIGLSLRLDALSATMLLLVAFVGWAVVRYARSYMAGDPGHGRFTRALAATLAAVLTMTIAGNLLLLILAWIATSMALHRLLLFYPERVNAILAARKKFVAARLGDAALIGAALLLFSQFGTWDVAALAGLAKSAVPTAATTAAALLIAIAALLKCAQLPLHGWLTEVMETPTPVSALLHAGVVNAGGFLVLRLADVMLIGAPGLHLLAIVGAASALVASLVMLTQTSIKLALAWSTIAQMGFMLLQCGLGAFPAALLHIVAHSLYKAHAFLSSGSVVDILRASWSPSPGGRPHPWRTGVAVALVVGVAAVASSLVNIGYAPATFALVAILAMGIVTLLAAALDERPQGYVIVRTLGSAIAVAGLYVLLQAGAVALTMGTLPTAGASGQVDWAIAIGVVAAFAALTLLQGWLPTAAHHPRLAALWVHATNGFYLNTHANRLALALWPARKGA